MGHKTLTEEQRRKAGKRSDPATRRAMVLEALQPDANLSKISRDYGIHRNTLYELLEVACTDPKGKLAEAEAEVAFRRKVWELVR